MFCRVLLTTAAVVLAGCSRENGVQTVAAADKAAATFSGGVGGTGARSRAAGSRRRPSDRREPVAQPAFLIPAGTRVRVRLAQTLDTKYSRPGSTFGATLADPIVVGNRVVVPQRDAVHGFDPGIEAIGAVPRARAPGDHAADVPHEGCDVPPGDRAGHAGQRISQEAESGIDGRRVGGGRWNRRAGGGWNGRADRCGRGRGGGNDDGVFHGQKECDAAGGNADGVPDAVQRSGAA